MGNYFLLPPPPVECALHYASSEKWNTTTPTLSPKGVCHFLIPRYKSFQDWVISVRTTPTTRMNLEIKSQHRCSFNNGAWQCSGCCLWKCKSSTWAWWDPQKLNSFHIWALPCQQHPLQVGRASAPGDSLGPDLIICSHINKLVSARSKPRGQENQELAHASGQNRSQQSKSGSSDVGR